MNIFVLHPMPDVAARMQCDKHVPKMTLETAQMLCTVINELGGQAPYKSAHVNHPCSVWARETLGNFLWLWEHGMALAKEYTERYGKVHKSEAVIRHCRKAIKDVACLSGPGFKSRKVTPHPLCMPDQYKCDDVFESYRRYYIGEKFWFAQWNKTTEAPSWWPERTDIR
jgi:hypothetical protein